FCRCCGIQGCAGRKFLWHTLCHCAWTPGRQCDDIGLPQCLGEAGPVSAKLIGVGTGPGDPELLTLKAARAIASADVVAYFAKRGNPSNARAIAADLFRPGQIEEALDYPVTTEIYRHANGYRDQIGAFYAEAAARLAMHLDAGRTVAVLSEGDPLFYGSYMHIHVRLAPRYDTEVIPGITAMSGCW